MFLKAVNIKSLLVVTILMAILNSHNYIILRTSINNYVIIFVSKERVNL